MVSRYYSWSIPHLSKAFDKKAISRNMAFLSMKYQCTSFENIYVEVYEIFGGIPKPRNYILGVVPQLTVPLNYTLNL